MVTDGLAQLEQGYYTFNVNKSILIATTDVRYETMDIILDQEMMEIAADFHQQDTQKLLAHGRFLENGFSKDDILY